MMFLAKLKVIAWTVFVVGAMLTTGAVSAKLIAQPVKNQPQADDPQSSSTKADPTAKSKSRRYKGPEHFGLSGNLVSYDEKTRKITLKLNGQLVPVTLDLDPNCKVTISDDPAKLSELKVGDEMILQLAEDNRTVKAIETNSEDEGGLELVELKLDERTVTLQHGGQTKTHNIRQNALVVLDGFRTELESLEFGMKLTIFFARDKSTITRIFAEWTRDGDLRGRVKLVNPEMTEFEVHHVPNNDEEEVYRVGLGPKTRVFVNGKGGKLDQVKPGMAITVRPDLKDAKLAAVLMAWDDDEPTKE